MRPILTAERMRAAEQAAASAGTSLELLMERAGEALAEAAWRFSGGLPALILCGPGNNGGDGYVAARHLARRGGRVRIAALGEPATELARRARDRWEGPVEPFGEDCQPAPLLIDCLFGTGLRNGLEAQVAREFLRLADRSTCAVACDLPSGADADSGALLSPVPRFAMTVTFGALKPAHRLYPAAGYCGRVVLADIGVDAGDQWHEIGAPLLPLLDPAGNKFTRGMVVALGGAMPGAIALAAAAAARAGAGYVRIEGQAQVGAVPAAIVQGQPGTLNDPRVGAVIVGPGLGRGGAELLGRALGCGRPLVIDADGLGLLAAPGQVAGRDAILTPHDGEFVRLFGELPGTRPERALEAARRSAAVVVMKGPDTLVASPDGRLGFAPPAPAWLATAGTGDVLAGIIAALRARGMAGFEAACGAVWLHGRAAERAGPAMIADDLVAAIPHALGLVE